MGILQNENAIPVASAGGVYSHQIEQSASLTGDLDVIWQLPRQAPWEAYKRQPQEHLLLKQSEPLPDL